MKVCSFLEYVPMGVAKGSRRRFYNSDGAKHLQVFRVARDVIMKKLSALERRLRFSAHSSQFLLQC